MAFTTSIESERALSSMAAAVAREVVLESNDQLMKIIEAQLLDYARKLVVVLARLRRAPVAAAPVSGSTLRELDGVISMDDAKRDALIAALRDSDGNKTKAARTLDVNTKTLYNLMHKYGLNGNGRFTTQVLVG